MYAQNLERSNSKGNEYMNKMDRQEEHETRYIFLSKKELTAAICIAALTFIIFLPSLKNDFVNWDDDVYVYQNTAIQHIDGHLFKWIFQFHASNWHPLTWFSHAVDYTVWDSRASGHHLTNILMHSINTFILCMIVVFLFRFAAYKEFLSSKADDGSIQNAIIVGGIAALLFGIHPTRVESVTWVAQRKDVLCTLFFLLSIFFYANYAARRKTGGKSSSFYVFSLLSFVLSIMSKPMAVTLPFVLLILDLYPFQRVAVREDRISKEKVFIEKIPFFVISLMSAILTLIAQKSGGALKPFSRTNIAISIYDIFFYLGKLVFPAGLSPLYPYPKEFPLFSAKVIVALLVIVSITIVCILAWQKKKRIFMVLWAFYIITLLPVLGFIKVGNQAAADRYTYIPGIGLFILTGLGIAYIVDKIVSKKQSHYLKIAILSLPFVLISCIFGIITFNQIKIWENSITLWTYVIKQYPQDKDAYLNRSNAFIMTGKYREAIRDLDAVIQINPTYEEAYNNRGLVYGKAGNYQSAIRDFSKAIALNPERGAVYNNRASTYFRIGEYQKGLQDLDKAIEKAPDSAGLYSNRCEAYHALNKYDQAIKDCSMALEIDPSDAVAYYIRGLSYYSSGNPSAAISDYNKSLEINTHNPKAYFSRGVFYKDKGELKKASEDFSRAIQFDRRYTDAYINRGVIYGEQNELQEAIKDFAMAIALNPKDASAFYNRGAAYYRLGKKQEAIHDFQQAAGMGDKTIQKILKDRGIRW
jgi:tetratricopeptide (TPR) repeat protein